MEWNLEEGGEARHHACMWATTGNVVFCFILLSPTPSAWYSRSCVLFCTLIPCPAARSDLEAATFHRRHVYQSGYQSGAILQKPWVMRVSVCMVYDGVEDLHAWKANALSTNSGLFASNSPTSGPLSECNSAIPRRPSAQNFLAEE